MGGYSSWPRPGWAVNAVHVKAELNADFQDYDRRETALPDGYPLRGEFTSRRAYRAAVAQWRKGRRDER